MDTTALLLAVCLGASSSRWQNDTNLWVVGAPTGNRFIDFLGVFLESERDIAGETETIILVRGGYECLRAREYPLYTALVDRDGECAIHRSAWNRLSANFA